MNAQSRCLSRLSAIGIYIYIYICKPVVSSEYLGAPSQGFLYFIG